jgi:hypothetical protein
MNLLAVSLPSYNWKQNGSLGENVLSAEEVPFTSSKSFQARTQQYGLSFTVHYGDSYPPITDLLITNYPDRIALAARPAWI